MPNEYAMTAAHQLITDYPLTYGTFADLEVDHLVAALQAAYDAGAEAERQRAYRTACDEAETFRRLPLQGRFTADYRAGAFDAAMHAAELIRRGEVS